MGRAAEDRVGRVSPEFPLERAKGEPAEAPLPSAKDGERLSVGRPLGLWLMVWMVAGREAPERTEADTWAGTGLGNVRGEGAMIG